MNQEILVRKIWKENFAYTVNAEFVPVAAYMEDGTFAVPSEDVLRYDVKEAGLNIDRYTVITAVIGEETTSLWTKKDYLVFICREAILGVSENRPRRRAFQRPKNYAESLKRR